MKKAATRLFLGVAFLVLGIGVVTASNSPPAMADLKTGVQAVADALEKGDSDGASKAVTDAAKGGSVEDAMHLFNLRARKGFGIGESAGKVSPDGIEAKINNFSKKLPQKGDLTKDSDALVKMAYRTAAVAEFALKKAPEKDMGDKKVKDWNTYATNMRTGSLELADALKTQDPAKVRAASQKITQSCSSCHGTFRD